MTNNNKTQAKSAEKDEHLLTAEGELRSFYDYCKENGLTDDEIKTVCQPLTDALKKRSKRQLVKDCAVFTALLLTLYALSHVEFVAWNVSAVGRILMIEMLPYWNWLHLSKEKCLFPKFLLRKAEGPPLPLFDCILCESLDAIPAVTDVDPDFLNQHYLNLHTPVIVTDGLRNWPSANPNFNLTQRILSDPALRDSYPCLQLSNVIPSSASLGKIVSKLQEFPKHFAHFLNCDFKAVKHFRLLSPRPYFFAAEISPVQYSWVLMSSNYESPKFKGIELREKTTVFTQISGGNFVRLSPRSPCENECNALEVEVQAGEALVITSLWNLEYKPNPATKNVAFVLEAI